MGKTNQSLSLIDTIQLPPQIPASFLPGTSQLPASSLSASSQLPPPDPTGGDAAPWRRPTEKSERPCSSPLGAAGALSSSTPAASPPQHRAPDREHVRAAAVGRHGRGRGQAAPPGLAVREQRQIGHQSKRRRRAQRPACGKQSVEGAEAERESAGEPTSLAPRGTAANPNPIWRQFGTRCEDQQLQ
jgi:hypothetical protein